MSLSPEVQNAVDGIDGGIRTVQRGFDIFGTIFQVLLWGIPLLFGGAWLLNAFADQPWAQGIRDWLSENVGGLVGMAPEWLQNLFPEYMRREPDGAALVNGAAAFGVIPRDLAQTIIRNDNSTNRDADNATLTAAIARSVQLGGRPLDITRLMSSGGNLAEALSGEHLITALMLNQNGRDMLARLRNYRPTPTTPREGEAPTTPVNLIATALPQALRRLFANNALMTTIEADPAAMNYIYDTAQQISGITIENPARQALSSLPADMRRQLFASFVGEDGQTNTQEVSRALMTIVNAPETGTGSVPSATIHTLLNNITTPALTESATAEQRSMHQTLTQLRTLDVAQITTLRTNIRELGPELVESFINQPVATLVRERSNPEITPVRLASLLSLAPADVVSPQLSSVISTEAGAGELLGVVNALETAQAGSFVGLMGAFDYLRDHAAPPAAAVDATPETRAAQLRTYHQERAPHIRTIARALVNPEVRAFITAHPEMLPEGTSGMLTNFLPRNVAEADAFAAIISRGDEVFNSAEGNVRETFIEGVTEAVSDSHNFTNLLDLLFKDELREHLLEDEAMQSAIVTIAAQEPVQPASTQRGYDERTVRALLAGNSSATAINTHNLEALVNLVNTIDDATGGGQNEDAADARNQRVVNFFLRLAANQQPAVNDELAEDFSVLFRDQRVVEAVQNYLGERGTGEGGIQLEGFTEAQQAFIRALRDNLWIDDNNNGTIDRRQDGFDIAFDADAGLAPYLASRSSAMNILHAITGNNGILGFHSESWWSDMAIPLDWLNGPLSRIKTTSEAVDRERDALPTTVSGGVEVAETECRPVPGQPTVTYCGWPGNRSNS